MPGYNPPFAPTYHQRLDCDDFVMETDPGATLRDVIAIEAMKVLLPYYVTSSGRPELDPDLARDCYAIAGVMLLEKAKREAEL